MKTEEKKTEKTGGVDISKVLALAITEKQGQLTDIDTLLEPMKEERKEIFDALKILQKDLSHLMKYLSTEQQEYINSLGLDTIEVQQGTMRTQSGIPKLALDIVQKHGFDMTNEELHHAYLDTLSEGKQGLNYTAFNIALRPAMNSGKLIRKLVEGGNSRTDIVSVGDKIE